jgi:hypothetical protein
MTKTAIISGVGPDEGMGAQRREQARSQTEGRLIAAAEYRPGLARTHQGFVLSMFLSR